MANRVLEKIREAAGRYPEAEEALLFGDHPVYRVRKKVFVWLGERDEGGTYLGLKLKQSQSAALSLPFTSPMAYGMAKWGWINAEFPKGKEPPLGLLLQWLDESYRNTAPKQLLKVLDGGPAPAAAKKAAKKRKPAAKKRPARRTRSA